LFANAARHKRDFALHFNPAPPYEVRSTRHLDAATLRRIANMAMAWDRVANSGRFPRTLALLLGAPNAPLSGAAFLRFLAFADFLTTRTGRTHSLALEDLAAHLHAYLAETAGANVGALDAALAQDYVDSGARGRLALDAMVPVAAPAMRRAPRATLRRQATHLAR
jgi:hypothetical protein